LAINKLRFYIENPQTVNSILIVRKHNHLGDMIVSLPLYYALRKKFTSAKIILVAAKTAYPIPLKQINPLIDEVYILENSTLISIIKTVIKLRKHKFQIGIVPSTIRLSTTSHIINFLSGAEIRVGVANIDGKKNNAAFLLNVKKYFEWEKNNVNQSIRNHQIAQLLKAELTENEIKEIRISPKKEALDYVKKKLYEHFGDDDNYIIGIHPGAGKSENIWDPDNFYKLIIKMKKSYSFKLVITCGAMDKEIVNKLTNQLKQNNIQYFVDEGFSLQELLALMSNYKLLITNDTGIMHIAGLLGISIISLFGPTNPYEWAPKNDNSVFIKSSSGKINDITVNEVINDSEKFLS